MPDGKRAVQFGEFFLVKNIRDQAHRLMHVQRHAVGGHDAGGFLSPMLQRMQPEVGEFFRLRVGVNCDHSTLVVKFVGRKHMAFSSWLLSF